MNPTISKLSQLCKESGIHALLVSSCANISYLTRIISRDSYLLVSPQKNIYFTDARYSREAGDTLGKDFSIQGFESSGGDFLSAVCKKLGLRRIGFEARHLSFLRYRNLHRELGRLGQRLVPTEGLVEQLRELKSPDELRKIGKAIEITVQALRHIRGFLKPGRRELEVAGELERFIRVQGASGAAFEIIVASGPNSSYPHHITGARRLRNNEPVLIDLGVGLAGYKSDLTRTFFLGKITPLYRRVYVSVQEAQTQAIKKISLGIKASEVDAAARNYLVKQGFGRYFSHSLGHGVGLEVHEGPLVSAKSSQRLLSGMVFTIEPGVYLPHRFGVRLEDTVFLTEKGVVLPSVSLNQ